MYFDIILFLENDSIHLSLLGYLSLSESCCSANANFTNSILGTAESVNPKYGGQSVS